MLHLKMLYWDNNRTGGGNEMHVKKKKKGIKLNNSCFFRR